MIFSCLLIKKMDEEDMCKKFLVCIRKKKEMRKNGMEVAEFCQDDIYDDGEDDSFFLQSFAHQLRLESFTPIVDSMLT